MPKFHQLVSGGKGRTDGSCYLTVTTAFDLQQRYGRIPSACQFRDDCCRARVEHQVILKDQAPLRIMREERLPCLAMCKGTAKRPQTERPERATVGKFIKHRRVSWIIGGDPGHPVQRQTRRVGGGLHMRPSVRSRVEVDTKTSYP